MKKTLVFLSVSLLGGLLAAASVQTPGNATRTTVGAASVNYTYNKATLTDATGNSTAAGLPVASVGYPTAQDLTLTSTSAWTYVLLTAPGDITFQNTSNLTLYWWQTPTSAVPTQPGFQMAAGAAPLNIPVASGTQYFWWTYTTTGANVPAQAHH